MKLDSIQAFISGLRKNENRTLKSIQGKVIFSEEGSPETTAMVGLFDKNLKYNFFSNSVLDFVGLTPQIKQASVSFEKLSNEEIVRIINQIETIIRDNHEDIFFIESEFEGRNINYYRTFCYEPILDVIQVIKESTFKLEGFLSKSCVHCLIGRSNSFFEIGWRVLYSIIHRTPIIFKVSKNRSHSAFLWSEILSQTSLAPSNVNFLLGDRSHYNTLFFEHPSVKNLSIAGNLSNFDSLSYKTGKDYQFYFGGKNILAVTEPNVTESTIDFVLELLLTIGPNSQYSIERILVLDVAEDIFIKKLINRLETIKTISNFNEKGFFPLNEEDKESLKKYEAAMMKEGAKKLFQNDDFLLMKNLPNCSDLHQKQLGIPIITIDSVKYIHEMIRWVNNSSYGQCLFIVGPTTKDSKLYLKSEVGNVYLNAFPKGLSQPIKASHFGIHTRSIPNPFFSYLKNIND